MELFMTVFSCKSDFDSMMTCIYEAWASRKGHSQVKLMPEPIYEQELFTEYIHVEADQNKSESVVRSIMQKVSTQAYVWVYYASRSHEEDALDTIYRFLVLGFHYGQQICDMLQNPVVIRMMELRRNVGNESHYFREFLRFHSIDQQLYIAHIEPKNDVLVLVANHFAERMISENWIIVDDSRNIAVIHPINSEFYTRILTDEERSKLQETENMEDRFVTLWKDYFQTIAITERTNPVCQRNHIPIWMRKHVVEFE